MTSSDAPENRPPMPMWVKVFIAIGIAFAVLLVAVLVFGGEDHGPGRHMSGDHGTDDADDPVNGCVASPFSHGGGSGTSITCDGNADAPVNGAFDCAVPAHGGLELDWELDSGGFTLTVRDSAGAVVDSDTYTGSGTDSAAFAEGKAGGGWRLELVPELGFAGTVTAQTFCASS